MRKTIRFKLVVPSICVISTGGMLLQTFLLSGGQTNVGSAVISGDGQPVLGTSMPSVSLPSPEIYKVIAQRPIFSASRRPLAEPPTDQSAGLPAIDFSVIGIVNAPDKKIALILGAAGAAAEMASVGSVIDGWTIIQINNSNISLQSGKIIRMLKITQ